MSIQYCPAGPQVLRHLTELSGVLSEGDSGLSVGLASVGTQVAGVQEILDRVPDALRSELALQLPMQVLRGSALDEVAKITGMDQAALLKHTHVSCIFLLSQNRSFFRKDDAFS